MASQPMRLTDLISLEELQRIQDAFAEATGVASIITDVEGIPITRPSRFCRLCNDIIRKTEKGLCNCMHSDAMLGKLHPDGPIMQPCLSGGLWDGGTSICVGNTHIANWLIGQVRNDALDESAMMAYARQIGADEEDFHKALGEVTVMSVSQFEKVCRALYLIAGQISSLAYNNQALRQSEAKLETTLNSIGDAVIATDADGAIVRMNPVAERLTGWTETEAKGCPIDSVMRLVDAESGAHTDGPFTRVRAAGRAINLPRNMMLIDRSGTRRHIADSAAPIRDTGGAVIVFRDTSEQLRMEEQLRHSQKMDAMGQLSGGVAHDFNNMLGGILGAAEMLSKKLQDNPDALQLIGLITGAAEKAAGLTQSLLDFSRKGKMFSTPVDLHAAIRSAVSILERSVDRRIDITLNLAAEQPGIIGDPSQIQGLFLNLGINARDAMPDGGTLRIVTENCTLSAGDIAAHAAPCEPGPYILVQIEDTGCGIPRAILPRIYEPFFTTKEVGKGTGLGLSSVYAAVQEHHGMITVYSEEGHGTVFRLYFPTHAKTGRASERRLAMAEPVGHGTVLLVEDEPIMRTVADMILRQMGFDTLMAEDGEAGVRVFSEHHDRIRLVILDIVMPRLSGREAFFRIRAISPEVPVIFTSGFTRSCGINDLLEIPRVLGFIQKPYRKASICEMVHRLNDLEPHST